jgi:hypothetical protein
VTRGIKDGDHSDCQHCNGVIVLFLVAPSNIASSFRTQSSCPCVKIEHSAAAGVDRQRSKIIFVSLPYFTVLGALFFFLFQRMH